MKIDKLLEILRKKPVQSTTPALLESLLEECVLLREERPAVAEPLRLFRCGDSFIFQETSDAGEILVRRFETEEAAGALIAKRLDAYDRIWDGCGCKIDYHEKA